MTYMLSPDRLVREFDDNFNLFYDLMPHKVREILLISSPYDAFVLEEDGSLPHRIISEYHGLNLSAPPRLTRASSFEEAGRLLKKRRFDLVLTMPFVGNLDAFSMGSAIKRLCPKLPVILLASHPSQVRPPDHPVKQRGIDRLYIWSGDANLLFAIIKNFEDHSNADHDTVKAMVRVIILVEDSPVYLSTFLPLLYNAVVRQTQAVLEESLNEEHRLLKMRARPKILIAADYEEALALFKRYEKYVFAVISDTRFPKGGRLDDEAGVALLTMARKMSPDVPLLLMSSDTTNQQRAATIPAAFVDKNHAAMLRELENFLIMNLGFGDFVFRRPDGTEVGRATDYPSFEKMIKEVPEESLLYHAERNHFSNWLMARSEIGLASRLSKLHTTDFSGPKEMRDFLAKSMHAFRKWRQLGVVSVFERHDFDPRINDFVKIGQGAMGGKARGVAFLASLLRHRRDLAGKFAGQTIRIPHTCVITDDGFAAFVEKNKLFYLSGGQDHIIAERFLAAPLPDWLRDELAAYLAAVNLPLAVRSSSLLEDARYRPYAGLYKTCMLANNHPDFQVRLDHLEKALKLVYASAYFAGPRAFSRSIGHSAPDAMPVIIQQLAGRAYNGYFYPAISGVAQSHNFYPVSYMRPDEGIASVALGFGRVVVEGERCLRFSPQYPQILPQFSTVDDILANAQRYFYALDLKRRRKFEPQKKDGSLKKLQISDLEGGGPLADLCSVYLPEEHRIRDSLGPGPKVLTFAQILKYKSYPLPEILQEMLAMGSEGMSGPVEVEFAVDLGGAGEQWRGTFYLLQIRPMAGGCERGEVEIGLEDRSRVFCLSSHSLGHGIYCGMFDIVMVKTESLSASQTPRIAREIARLNAELTRKGRKYLLIGPGRWGSADSSLGIPVQWEDIAGVGTMVELVGGKMPVEPSQGTHFFQNITSLGIPYLTVRRNAQAEDSLDMAWLARQPAVETEFLRHITPAPFTVKVNGRTGEGMIMGEDATDQ